MRLPRFLAPPSRCRRQQMGELAQLALPAHDRSLRPLLVVHRVEGEHHANAAGDRLQLDQRLDVVRLDAGDEIGEAHVPEASILDDLGIAQVALRDGWHAGSLHELDLVGSGSHHRVVELAAGTQIDRTDLHREAIGPPPGLDALLRRPQLPDVFDRRGKGTFHRDSFSRHGILHFCRHQCFSLRVEARDLFFRSRASAKRSRRTSHRLRYRATQPSSSRNGSGRSE